MERLDVLLRKIELYCQVFMYMRVVRKRVADATDNPRRPQRTLSMHFVRNSRDSADVMIRPCVRLLRRLSETTASSLLELILSFMSPESQKQLLVYVSHQSSHPPDALPAVLFAQRKQMVSRDAAEPRSTSLYQTNNICVTVRPSATAVAIKSIYDWASFIIVTFCFSNMCVICTFASSPFD